MKSLTCIFIALFVLAPGNIKAEDVQPTTEKLVLSTDLTSSTLSTPAIDPNVTTTPATSTLPPTTTTIPTTSEPTTPTTTTSTTSPAPNSTTIAPTTSTVPTPTTSTASPSTTPTPAPHPPRPSHWSTTSFIGGMVFALGMVAIGFVSFKFYKARHERNYHTL